MNVNTVQKQATKKELFKEVDELRKKVEASTVPPQLKEKANQLLTRLVRMAKYGGYFREFEKISHYIDWICQLPWGKKTEDILNLERAKQVLQRHHWAMEDIKGRILEFMATLKLTRGQDISNTPIICLVGLVGTGKTTLGKSIAEALGRKYARVPFGGMGSALDLRGQSRIHAEAEPGQIIKALVRAQSNNPVMLLDEIDRVAKDSRSDIMGVLVELLDPEQNRFYIDHYIDYPYNLSEVMFVATCNNTTNIATAVLDRMEVIQMPSYSDEEKIVIGRQYILPRVMRETGIRAENLEIKKDIWPKIVRPLGYDSGMRSLERTIERICRKIAKLIVEGKGKHFYVDEQNYKQFLPA